MKRDLVAGRPGGPDGGRDGGGRLHDGLRHTYPVRVDVVGGIHAEQRDALAVHAAAHDDGNVIVCCARRPGP